MSTSDLNQKENLKSAIKGLIGIVNRQQEQIVSLKKKAGVKLTEQELMADLTKDIF